MTCGRGCGWNIVCLVLTAVLIHYWITLLSPVEVPRKRQNNPTGFPGWDNRKKRLKDLGGFSVFHMFYLVYWVVYFCAVYLCMWLLCDQPRRPPTNITQTIDLLPVRLTRIIIIIIIHLLHQLAGSITYRKKAQCIKSKTLGTQNTQDVKTDKIQLKYTLNCSSHSQNFAKIGPEWVYLFSEYSRALTHNN